VDDRLGWLETIPLLSGCWVAGPRRHGAGQRLGSRRASFPVGLLDAFAMKAGKPGDLDLDRIRGGINGVVNLTVSGASSIHRATRRAEPKRGQRLATIGRR
jgi:hypothetical protein